MLCKISALTALTNRLATTLDRKLGPLTLVSGADASHGLSLIQLVQSVRIHEPHTRLILYDLGLNKQQREILFERAPNASIKTFDFSAYPDWFNIRVNAGQYAWKPVIIFSELANAPGPLCWMDAGNVLRSRLISVRLGLLKRGFFSLRSRGNVKTWTHPGMLSYLGLDASWNAQARCLNGACVAFSPHDMGSASLCSEWARLAQIRACIAPEGSDRSNHRQDQALLTALALKAGKSYRYPSRTFDFKIHQDVEQH